SLQPWRHLAMRRSSRRKGVTPLKRMLFSSLVLAVVVAGLCECGEAQDYDLAAPGALPPPSVAVGGPATLFQNVRVFDGKSATLSVPSNVLVRNTVIERISVNPIAVDANENATIIAGNGRVLMPGLIDAHWHSFM